MPEGLTAAPALNAQVLEQLEQQLETLLLRRYGEITEQQLLSLLQLKPFHGVTDSQLALFQLHFVLYHLLYRIAERWAQTETAYLEIGLARVKISPWQNTLPQLTDNKGAYYADWRNYWRMTPLALTERLTQFWQFYQKRYGTLTPINLSDEEALAILQLDWPCSLVELKKAFRKQSLKYHPDRGGDKQSFIRLSLAYKKVLQRL
ncbi:DNA-J related domain-containing protein [Alishewanella sp. d11]|uniref:DNA-J related domain-containing protein n=1 Tax=Alishewanella sp. d11 TaxID=3414030 RepID=UPI003BF8148A